MLLLGGRHLVQGKTSRGGLQEMDHPQLFRSITAWAGTAWETNRLADYIGTAARHAFAGRGAPVFLDVPMDVQFDMVEECDHHLAGRPPAVAAGCVGRRC